MNAEAIYYTVTYIGLFAAALGISSFMYYKMMTE
ncbi:hypothetical protein BN000_00672 [Neobacillus massiliamazoniensis]|uniref:Uncharacterized protein n=1 Tax=Neobacillus massiliamazoniensis TaxID=1499688 RepID=A0A0U1NRY5_9BACI|nr:hypothetical protein BN000_00672 [Neobacillus massiliamazoniensis]